MAPRWARSRAPSTALYAVCVMTAALVSTITDRRGGSAAPPGVAAVTIATPTPRSTLLRFPAPPDGPAAAGLHHVPGLQCDTAAPRAAEGRRGWWLSRPGTDTGARTFVPMGAGSCASAVVQPGVFGGAFDGDNGASTGLPASLNEDNIVVTDPVQRADLRNRLNLFTRVPIVSRFLTDLHYRPLPGGGNKSGDGWLASEAELVRALTLCRNTIAGAVHRESGEYDVLGVTRVTVGICLLNDCSDASAVDVVGSQSHDWSHGILPLLTVDGDEISPDPNSGEEVMRRTVSMADADVLTLGRASLADPAWLRSAEGGGAAGSAAARLGNGTWRTMAVVKLGTSSESSGVGHTDAGDAESYPGLCGQPGTCYFLNEDATDVSRRWETGITSVLCRPPVSAFVRHEADQVCGESPASATPAPPTWVASGVPTTTAVADVAPRPATAYATWFVSPRVPALDEASSLPPCPPLDAIEGVSGTATTAARPAWVAARAEREVNPASPVEAALAAATTTCGLDVAAAEVGSPTLAWPLLLRMRPDRLVHFGQVEADLRRMSTAFDSSAFDTQRPDEPATTGPALLALIVLVPEAIALVGILMGNPMTRRRELALAGLFFVAGLVSTAGIINLAVVEVQGASWRATTVRDALQVDLGSNVTSWATKSSVVDMGVNNLMGAVVVHTETVVVVARSGYRPRLLTGLAAAFTCAYMVLSAVVVGYLVRGKKRSCGTAPTGEAEEEATLVDAPTEGSSQDEWPGASLTAEAPTGLQVSIKEIV